MTIPIYYDIEDYPVGIGTMVAITEQYWSMMDTPDKDDIFSRTYQVVAIHDESGELGLAEITDNSGSWEQWRPNLAIPLQWEWNYQKYAAI